jgi:hypothetical protein
MSDSLRAKAAAAIRGTRRGLSSDIAIADTVPESVTTSGLTFTVDPDKAKWLAEAAARTRRALDPTDADNAA